MASIAPTGLPGSLSRLAWSILIAALVAGCVTTSRFEKNEYYPTGWPDIASASEDCRIIEGSYENKGLLFDEKGQSREVWFTDLWTADVLRKPDAYTYKLNRPEALRSCERVTLKIEEFAHPAGSLIPAANWQLVINPIRRSTAGEPGQFEPCESLRVPASREAGIGLCAMGSFFYRLSGGGADYETTIGLASDGSLLAKVHHFNLGAIPPIIFFWTDDAWARFNRSDTAPVKPGRELSALRSYYVVKLGPDARGVNQLIATELQRKGLEATTGPAAEAPRNIDAIVAYRYKWMGDLPEFMSELTVFIREPESQGFLATATSSQTPRTRKTPEEMVAAALTDIFSGPPRTASGSSGMLIALPPYESTPGARVAAPREKARVRIPPVRDDRRDAKGALIGERSALSVSLGKIEMAPTPVEMIGQLLRAELGMLGHGTAGTGAEFVIDARLTRFEVQTPSTLLYWHINGVIALGIVVTGRDGQKQELHYETTCTDRAYVIPSESLIKGVVSTCLANLGSKVREDPALARILGDRIPGDQ